MVILIRADLMVLMRLYRKYYIISHQKTQYDYKGMQSTRLAIHKMCFFNALPLNLVCHGFPQRVGGTLIIPLTVARNKWIWASSKATQTFHLALLSPDVSFIWNDWKDAGKTAHRSLCLIPPFELLLAAKLTCVSPNSAASAAVSVHSVPTVTVVSGGCRGQFSVYHRMSKQLF